MLNSFSDFFFFLWENSPYGGVGWHPLDEFQDVIICAGGSGISFLVAAVAELISRAKDGGKTQRALVIFTVRDWGKRFNFFLRWKRCVGGYVEYS